jgi:hypothetical protein
MSDDELKKKVAFHDDRPREFWEQRSDLPSLGSRRCSRQRIRNKKRSPTDRPVPAGRADRTRNSILRGAAMEGCDHASGVLHVQKPLPDLSNVRAGRLRQSAAERRGRRERSHAILRVPLSGVRSVPTGSTDSSEESGRDGKKSHSTAQSDTPMAIVKKYMEKGSDSANSSHSISVVSDGNSTTATVTKNPWCSRNELCTKMYMRMLLTIILLLTSLSMLTSLPADDVYDDARCLWSGVLGAVIGYWVK